MIVVFHHSIVKATLEHAHNSMKNITEDFDKIEKQMNTPEVYDDDDPSFLERKCSKTEGKNIPWNAGRILVIEIV